MGSLGSTGMSNTSDGCTFPKLLEGLLNSPLMKGNIASEKEEGGKILKQTR